MAKANTTPVVSTEYVAPGATGETRAVYIPADWAVEAHGHKITTGDLNPAVVAYLLTNGFTQAISDAGAIGKADMEKRAKANGPMFDDDGEELDGIELAREQLQTERRLAKFNAILDGTISTRTVGPRVRGIDKVMRDVAKAWVLEAVAKAKMETPKAAALATLVDKYLAKYADKVRAEAERRMDSESVDLDDLLG